MRKVFRITVWASAGVLLLLLAPMAALQFEYVQNVAADRAARRLSAALGTRVELERMRLKMPSRVEILGLYLEDQKQDTLWYSGAVSARIDMFGLLSRALVIESLRLENVVVNLERTVPEGRYNFEFAAGAGGGGARAQEARSARSPAGARPWKIAVRSLDLSNIAADYRDWIDGQEFSLRLGTLSITMRDMDLDAMRFEAASIALRDAGVRVARSKLPQPREKEPAAPAGIVALADKLELGSVNLRYIDVAAGESAGVYLGELSARGICCAFGEGDIRLASLVIERSVAGYRREKDVSAAENGIDFSNLELSDLRASVTDVHLMNLRGSMRLGSFAFRERSGFCLENLSAAVAVDDSSAILGDLRLETGFSSVTGAVSARYPALESIREDPGNIRIDLDLAEAFVGFGDAVHFRPDLREHLDVPDAEGITLQASIAGRLDDLAIDRIELSALGATRLGVRGRVRGLPDIGAAHFDLAVKELGTGRDDVVLLVGVERIPAGVSVPAFLNMAGTFVGTAGRFETRLQARSDFGPFAVDLLLDREGEIERYRGALGCDGFDLGRLLGMPDLVGAVSLAAAFEGRGFDEQELDVRLDATVESIRFRDHAYGNARIDGRFRDRRFTGFAGMEDDNLAFSFDGDVDLAPAEPRFSFDLDLRRADLHALGLLEAGDIARGSLKADFTGASIGTIEGGLQVRDFVLARGMTEHAVDSLILSSATRDGISRLTLSSDILCASYQGSVPIADLPAVVTAHVNRYFDLHLDAEDDAPDEHFVFMFRLHEPHLLAEALVPDLHALSSSTMEGSYSGRERLLEARADVARLHYGSIEVDSLRLRLESGRNSIGYGVSASKLALKSFAAFAPEIRGLIEDNVVSAEIVSRDEALEVVFALGGEFESDEEGYTFRLKPDRLVIDYQPWTVAEDNFVRFGGGVLYVNNLALDRAGALIAAQSKEGPEAAPPIGIAVGNFDISGLPRMLGRHEPELAGVLGAEITLEEILGEMKIAADLSLSGFALGGAAVGDVTVSLGRESPERYDLRASLSGHGNRLLATGYAGTGDGADDIDLTVDIRNIELASLEGFALGQLADMRGRLYGEVRITGSLSDPAVSGAIVFSQASFTVAPLNSRLLLADEKIAFGEAGIAFRDFSILDSLGNRAVIDGSISPGGPSGLAFAVDIRSTDFLLLNTMRRHNDRFYGKIRLESDISIRGDLSEPAIRAAVGFRRGTDLTVVVPEQDPTLVDREGVVEFARIDDEGRPIREPDGEIDRARSAFRGIDLAANIEIDPQTNVRVIIDETAGDYVRLRGRGTLGFGIDPSGLASLTGRYEITEGAYQMTFYEVSRRRFDIRRGSSIVWTGDPLDAEIDISAIYTVRTTPLELVGDYVPDAERRQYRRLLPFQVYLNMQGRLMQPEIDFEIDMPGDQRGAFGGIVYSRVRQLNEQESERNKQVFALLVLGRFIAENPFDIQEGDGLSAGVRTSASKLLTQQLNALSRRYIPGLDITFDVESYEEYTEAGPQGRTELQLQVSRRFLDERMMVEVGGQFDIEGEQKRQAEASDIAGDLTVEYRLTEDGRFRLRGFRLQDYHGLIDGELTTTGLSLVFTREFNRFRELLWRRRTEQPPGGAAAPEAVDEGAPGGAQ